MTVAFGDDRGGAGRVPIGPSVAVLAACCLLTFTWMFLAHDRREATVIFFYGLSTAIAVFMAGRWLRGPSILVLVVSVVCAVPAFTNPYRLLALVVVFIIVSVFIGWLTLYPARVLLNGGDIALDVVTDAELEEQMTPALAARTEGLDAWLRANEFEYLGLVRKVRNIEAYQLAYRKDTTYALLGVLATSKQAWVEFSTCLDDSHGLLTTSPMAGFFKVDQVLLQHVHHAEPDRLLPLHEQALRRVEARGVVADPARPELVGPMLTLFVAENRALVLKHPLRFGWYRRRYQRNGTSSYDGPAWERPDFERRIAAIKAAAAA